MEKRNDGRLTDEEIERIARRAADLCKIEIWTWFKAEVGGNTITLLARAGRWVGLVVVGYLIAHTEKGISKALEWIFK